MTNSAVRMWFAGLDWKTYAGIGAAVIGILGCVAFGILPDQSLKIVFAYLSGIVWFSCLFIVVFGLNKVDMETAVCACLIGGGLTTSIPSLFYESTPVDWGSALTRLGFAIAAVKFTYGIYRRVRDERDA